MRSACRTNCDGATEKNRRKLDRAAGLVDGLVVYPERMRANLDCIGALFFSEAVLLSLVKQGRPRQAAYEMVQRSAMKTIGGEGRFRDNLAADAGVAALLSPDELARCFDLDHALSHVDAIIERALRD